MTSRLQQLAVRREAGERGIGTVDVLIYIAVVIIVLALAIPAIGSLRNSGYKSNMKGDLKNAAVAVTEYAMDADSRPGPHTVATVQSWLNANQGMFRATDKVHIQVQSFTLAGAGDFCLTVSHDSVNSAEVDSAVYSYRASRGKIEDGAGACA